MPQQQDPTNRQQALQESNPFNEQEDRSLAPKADEYDQIMDKLLNSNDSIDNMPEEFQPLPTDVGGTAEVLERMMNQTNRPTDEVMFRLRGKDARGHAMDLVMAMGNGDISTNMLETVLNPPTKFLNEVGMTEAQWQESINLQVKQLCGENELDIALPPNGDLRDNLLHLLKGRSGPGSVQEKYKNVIERSAGGSQSYDPEHSARELLRLSYDDSLSPAEREASLNAALSRLPDGVRRNEVRRELNKMRDEVECAVYDLDVGLTKNPPDAADIQAVLRGKSKEEIDLISLRYAQHTGYTGDPREGALNDAITLMDNSTTTDARTAILSRFDTDTQQGFKNARLDRGGLDAEHAIDSSERDLLMKGFDPAEIAKAMQVQITKIGDEHKIGDNILDFFSGNWSESGSTYQGAQRLMLGLSKSQVDQVAEAYGKGNLSNTIGEHAQNLDGFTAEEGKYAGQNADEEIDPTEMEERAKDVLAALIEHEANTYSDLSDKAKEEQLEASRQLVRDAFSGLSEEQAGVLQRLVQGKRTESLTETEEVKDEEGKPVLDDDGKPTTREVVNREGKPVTFNQMLRSRLSAQVDPELDLASKEAAKMAEHYVVTVEIAEGFSASRTANRLLESFRNPPVESVADRNARMKEVMRGLSADQAAEVNTEYKRMLEQQVSLRLDITENVYSQFGQGFTEILNNGSPARPGVESLPDSWKMTDPIELVNQLDRNLNGIGRTNAERAQNTLQMLQGLDDTQLTMLGPISGTFQRGALTQLVTEANSPLEQIDREIARDALKLGFNPWTRAQALRDAVGGLATDEAQALAKIRDELQKAQEGVGADIGAERIELMRRVYRQQTGHELEEDLTRVEDDLTDAEDALLEKTRPEAEPAAPVPEPEVEPRVAPGVERVKAVDTAPAEVKTFVARYADAAAIAESETGVPAEVLLAEAGRISHWGQRDIVSQDNPFHRQAPRGYVGETRTGQVHEENQVQRRMLKYDDLADAFADYAESLRRYGPADLRDTDFSDDPVGFTDKFLKPKLETVYESHSAEEPDKKIKTLEDNLGLLTR